MTYSLIVCTYNRDKFIYQTLEHIAHNSFDKSRYELLVIDNNSSDTTQSLCQDFANLYPEVTFRYFLEKNQGLSYARNRGIVEAQGDFLIFLDDDSFIAQDYLVQLDQYLAHYPDAIAFGGRIAPLFESGITPAWLCSWTYSWVSAINLGNNVTLFKDNKYPIGANMGIKKSALNLVGNFNTQLGRTYKNLMAGEEKDLFLRLRQINNKIYYFPKVFVQHVIPPQRTTKEYIIKMALGVGMSEKLRCLKFGKVAYLKRLVAEAIKWCATCVLWLLYLLRGKIAIANILVLFRWYVTKGLLSKNTKQ